MAGEKSDAALVAEKHYQLLMDKKHEEWLKTFTVNVQKQAASGMRGTRSEFYWNAGRSWVEKYGIRYEFSEEKPGYSEGEHFVFFRRVGQDGAQKGLKVKATMKLEDGKWKVGVPSY